MGVPTMYDVSKPMQKILTRSKRLCVSLWVYVIFKPVMIAYFGVSYLSNVLYPDDFTMVDADWYYQDLGLVLSLADYGVYLLCVVLWGVWLYALAARFRELGQATESPWWVLIMYAVPIYSLWGPYTYLRDVGKRQLFEQSGWTETLGLWWTLWILYNMGSNLLLHLIEVAYESGEVITALTFSIIDEVFALCLTIAALAMVRALTRRQLAHEHGHVNVTVEALD